MQSLPSAFMRADPLEAFDAFVDAFIQFWAVDRTVIRRLGRFAAQDPDLRQAL